MKRKSSVRYVALGLVASMFCMPMPTGEVLAKTEDKNSTSV